MDFELRFTDKEITAQFHSEFKTDLDLERLPSGKFATNDLVLTLAALAYNVLRLMGQSALLCPDAPVRHAAKRRRLEDGDTGIDLRERQGGRARTQQDSEFWSPLPSVCGVRASVWSVLDGLSALKLAQRAYRRGPRTRCVLPRGLARAR